MSAMKHSPDSNAKDSALPSDRDLLRRFIYDDESYFAQQTNQEIADQLNESKGAIDGRIRDARRML